MTLPVALDTNVLVCLLVNDDPAQAELAAALIDASSACFVPITVVLELEWVLRGAYKLSREAVIAAFEGLLAIRHLHLVRSEGCQAMISFDRSMAALATRLNLQPAVKQP